MRFNDDTRTRLILDGTFSVDPTGATVDVKVDDTWYPAAWLGTPAPAGTAWTQTARTVGYFAGPAVTAPAGAVILAAGRHLTEARIVTVGGDILAGRTAPVDVDGAAPQAPPPDIPLDGGVP